MIITIIRDLRLKIHIHCKKLELALEFLNTRYEGPTIWNLLCEDDKILSVSQLKTKLKLRYIDTY